MRGRPHTGNLLSGHSHKDLICILMALSLLHKSPKVPFYLKKKTKERKKVADCVCCFLGDGRGQGRAGQGRGKKRMRWRGLGLSRFCFPAPLAWTRTRAHQLCWVVRRWLLLVDLESTVMVGNTGHAFPGSQSPGSTEHVGCTHYIQCNQRPPLSRTPGCMKIWLGPLGLEGGGEGGEVDIHPRSVALTGGW